MKLFEKKSSIGIEEDDLKDARLSSTDFADESVKKRAFINVLGARLAMKMLFSQKIEANNLYSLYTIHSVIENLDIADIYFQGIKIDVRVIFNRDEIFIPKSHFTHDLLPDLYLVLELEKDFSSVDFLGFFEPKMLNKQNANKDYYFYEYDKLNDPKTIKTFLNDFVIESNFSISQSDIENVEELFISLVDKEISKKDKYTLFKQLAKDISLREKMVEFENFEIISREAAKNNDLIEDKVLDIIGVQQLFEDEINVVSPQVEIEDEIFNETVAEEQTIEETLTDENLLDLDVFVEEQEKEFFEDVVAEETESENEIIEKDNKGAISAGAAIGGAVIGGAVAGLVGGAATVATVGLEVESNLIKAGAETLSAGVELASELVKNNVSDFSSSMGTEDEIYEYVEIEEEAKSKMQNAKIDAVFSDEGALEMRHCGEGQSPDEAIQEENPSSFDEETIQPFDLSTLQPEIEVLENIEDIAQSEIEFLDNVEEKEEDLVLFDNEEVNEYENVELKNEFDELPELDNLENLKGAIEEKYFGSLESKEEIVSDNEVVDLDNFDFDILNETKADLQGSSAENLVSFESITAQGVNDILPEVEIEEEICGETEDAWENDYTSTPSHPHTSEDTSNSEIEENLGNGDDDEAMKKIRELEEEEVVAEVETTEEDESQDKSDEFISQVDEFLKDADFSKENLEFLDETLILDLDSEEEPVVNSLQTLETAYSSNLPVQDFEQEDEIQEILPEEVRVTNDKNEINLLFKEEKTDDMPELNLEEKKFMLPSIKDKKMVIAASVVSIVFVSVVIGGSILHNKNNEMKFSKDMSSPLSAQEQPINNISQDDTTDMDMTQPVSLQTQDTLAQQQAIPEENQPIEANRDMGKAVSDAFLSEPVNATISKVAWEVPEDFAYNDGFRKYLQIAGKNLKLNLQNNLLLATEMAYSNKVVIDLVINKDGSLQSENLVTSSGSKQIDKIVLQSVKETLMYLKMPSGELGSNSVNATLIINF